MTGSGVRIETDVQCTLRDGVVLRADVYRPDDDDRHPALLLRTPYGKHLSAFTHLSLDPVRAALAGYVVVIQDARGRFASEGEGFFPYRDEFDDGHDAAEWAASLPYADGQVGGYGVSYMGGMAWHMAATRPAGLRAISPTQTANDQFDNVMWRGGAFQWGTHLLWSLGSLAPLELLRTRALDPETPAAFAALVDAVDAFDELAAHLPPSGLPAADPDAPFLPYFFDTMRHPTRGPFHAERSMTGRHRDVEVPALIIAGWHDVLLGSDLQHFAAMRTEGGSAVAREQTRLVLGPWTHGLFGSVAGELDYGLRASGMALDLKGDMTALQLRWFDRWMRGGPDDDQPRVKLFVQGANRWRDEEDWPLSRARATPWYLGADGTLGPEPPAADAPPRPYVYDPTDPCPTLGGNLLLPRTYVPGPVDQAAIVSRSDVLVYTSAPLEHDLEITGPVTAVLFAATSAPDTDWVIKLCDVHPGGRTLNICDGVLRARFRDRDWSRDTLVEPEAVVRYEIDMWATSIVLGAGHRLCVLVTSSDFPRYDRNPNTGEHGVDAPVTVPARQRLFGDAARPSHVVLPVV